MAAIRGKTMEWTRLEYAVWNFYLFSLTKMFMFLINTVAKAS